LLTGEVPFTGDTPIAIGYKHVHVEVPRTGINEAVDEVLKIALAKEREKRFQNGMAMVKALEQALKEVREGADRKVTPVMTDVDIYRTPERVEGKEVWKEESYQQQVLPSVEKVEGMEIVLKKGPRWLGLIVLSIFLGVTVPFVSTFVLPDFFKYPAPSILEPEKERPAELSKVQPSPSVRSGVTARPPISAQSSDIQNVHLITTLTGHTAKVTSVSFSPDGQILASGSWDKTIKLWRVSDGRLIRTLTGHTNHVNSVSFSPDGQILASGSDDKTIKLWRVSDGSLIRTIEGHTGSVESVTFSPDGQILASGSDDKTIKLWRVSDGSLIGTLEGHTDAVLSVSFSPDGQILASGSDDNTIKIWRLE